MIVNNVILLLYNTLYISNRNVFSVPYHNFIRIKETKYSYDIKIVQVYERWSLSLNYGG